MCLSVYTCLIHSARWLARVNVSPAPASRLLTIASHLHQLCRSSRRPKLFLAAKGESRYRIHNLLPSTVRNDIPLILVSLTVNDAQLGPTMFGLKRSCLQCQKTRSQQDLVRTKCRETPCFSPGTKRGADQICEARAGQTIRHAY
jgi:hypothetical protein